MDVTPVYQTVSYATKDQWDTSDNDSLTATADENDPDMNDLYQRLVSTEDENYFDSDNGSVTDIDGSMSEGAYCVVSDDGSVSDLDMDRLDNVDYDDSDVWSVTDFSSCSSDVDVKDDCVLNIISIADRKMNVYDRRLCLLCPVGTADLRILRDGSVCDLRMDHSRTISWDPGIADSLTISVYYHCLCLMALFRTVMYLAHYWNEKIVWTGPDEGSGRYMAWREQYLPGLYLHCAVDWLHEVATEIKVFHCVSMSHVDENNSGRRCACVRGVSLGMFSVGRISLMLTGCSVCVGGSVDCSDWPRADCAVDFSPGEVRIGYIRPGLWTDLLIDAAPVTGSLIDSALSDCLIVLCTAGFSSTWSSVVRTLSYLLDLCFPSGG